jgi:hypothetical protein
MPVDPNTHSALGKRLTERTQPLAPDDATYGYAHAALCEGMMLPFEQVAEIIDPPDPLLPWEPLFDLDLCPDWALPWLGQLVGVRVPIGLSEDDMRRFVRELALHKRGSPEAIIAAAKFALTGSQTVILHERDAGSAYRIEVVTFTNETLDPAALTRAILSQKPGGIVLASITTTGWIYQDMTLAFTGKFYKDIVTTYPTYAHLTAKQGQ